MADKPTDELIMAPTGQMERSGGLSHPEKVAFDRNEGAVEKKDVAQHTLRNTSEHVLLAAGEWGSEPTEEEKHGPNKLRRISGKINWPTYLIAFVELCERFSYYGTTAVFTNFIQRPLPPGSTTGANPSGTPGALGMGTNASQGLTTFNSFWVYVIPLFGAYVADTHLGRFRTVCWSVLIALIGHVLMTISAIPPVISNSHGALACFIIALIIMGLGTGGFKANISPLVAEQHQGPETMVVVTTSKGERVIMDPAITTARIYLYFYLMINIGALVGQIGMTYSEKYVGYWLAYMLPTIMFCLCPIVLFIGRNMYTKSPPRGSVLSQALRIWRVVMRPCFTLQLSRARAAYADPAFWDRAKPGRYMKEHGGETPRWLTWDDEFVDEVKRGFKACQVFLFHPLYWISYNQLNNNLTSQAATMSTHGFPNDVINNLDPLALIIFIPICDMFLYPGLRHLGINFSPLKRIFTGFMLAAAAMVWAAVVQYYIYHTSPCGFSANDPTCDPSPLNVWIQSGAYVLIAFSEIFASITGLEYAFTKAPRSMRSLVMSVFLFMSAISSALNEALNPLAGDPLLIWNYGVAAVISFVAGLVFWLCFYKLDREEDELNRIGRVPTRFGDEKVAVQEDHVHGGA
ncbi:PTR2-domain-containing protein [Calocera cornea HHB12733]|uniref:PTR2-domain-containing protein n=1 Tax=Calocera cornea HHB12733 TaxID=1353952 RepID=A0A165GER8_9BASI|nr:PTR2-domain-containing protein [Calocera cornea HHB12733]